MSSITVGCPKCRGNHSVEVWDDNNFVVDEELTCTCGTVFSVLIQIRDLEEDKKYANEGDTPLKDVYDGNSIF